MRTRSPVNYDAIAHLYDGQPYRAKKADPELSALLKSYVPVRTIDDMEILRRG